jgi:TonB family protein
MGEPALKLVETRTPGRSPILAPLGISLAFHLILFLTAPLFHTGNQLPLKPERTKVMRVKIPRTKPEEPKPILDMKGQVVDIEDDSRVSKEPPADSQFLSDRNRRVDRQSQARMTGVPPETSGGPSGPSQPQQAQPKQEVGESGKVNLKLPDSFLKESVPMPKREERMAALAPSNYLPEIGMGDETLLNTREYIYASFFVRMKRQMEGVWNPRRILAGEPDVRNQYVTKVSIVLSRNGRLDSARIVGSSGDMRLDREALEAVERAAPYLNPPPGLLGPDGKIRIPEWHFIVTTRAFF